VQARVNALMVLEGGISRLSLTSDAWHKQHPWAAKHFFGFENWLEVQVQVHAAFGVWPVPRPKSSKRVEVAVSRKRKGISPMHVQQPRMFSHGLSEFEQILLVMMYFTTGCVSRLCTYDCNTNTPAPPPRPTYPATAANNPPQHTPHRSLRTAAASIQISRLRGAAAGAVSPTTSRSGARSGVKPGMTTAFWTSTRAS
jgi:hypothetical protein